MNVCVYVCVCVCAEARAGWRGCYSLAAFSSLVWGLGLRVERVEGLEDWGLRFEKVIGRLRVEV